MSQVLVSKPDQFRDPISLPTTTIQQQSLRDPLGHVGQISTALQYIYIQFCIWRKENVENL